MNDHSPPATGAPKSSQSQLDLAKAPGHWVLASLGKRVLRPGGLEATRLLLDKLSISPADDVVEFAPGIGITAEMILKQNPATYTGVDRDSPAIDRLRQALGSRANMINANVQESRLPAESATRLVGEAMLSMHPNVTKQAIITEANRVLKPGGLYGLHELAIADDHPDEKQRQEMRRKMSQVVHNGVTPLTTLEWKHLLEAAGFQIESVDYVPFRLLSPTRLVRDEGLFGTMRIAMNLIKNPVARKRVLEMKRTFSDYGGSLTAVVIVAQKRTGSPT